MKIIALFLVSFWGCAGEDQDDGPSWCPKNNYLNGEGSVAVWAIGEYEGPWQTAAMNGCRVWEPLGISCFLVTDPDAADIVVDYYYDTTCQEAAKNDLFGSCGQQGGVWINTARECRESMDDSIYWDWLTQLIAHEIGHLLIISDIPSFCGVGIMNPTIERFQDYTPLEAITDLDRQACHSGDGKYLFGVELDCGVERVDTYGQPPDECSTEVIEAEPTTISLWFKEETIAWTDEVLAGCAWWRQMQISCGVAPSQDAADVIIRKSDQYCTGMGAVTFRDKTLGGRYAINIPEPCESESAEAASKKIERVAAHEIGHVLGVDHVPFFCADASMNPSGKPDRTCLTSADINAWRERFPR
ncbi:hypothetical protein A3D72_00455 [Candidatus Uhrbacteria bacterium RIFCSPHIGHO2_02_FULL_57_19]|uniref:Uncharacterized protein n=2 Tax=Candidatus Uhriibacteriota TaxID=1752732 RepID=A0A1F7U4B4_9BACT|nr:MAG: hypothetical protein A3D72_00455 [Candidatus Uhrbacteria bacterium RIFCSPHIGHO2_02_FULL_57_19]